jgi:carbonic anhydrase
MKSSRFTRSVLLIFTFATLRSLFGEPTLTPDAALARLLEGNQHYVAGTPTHPDQSVERRTSLAEGQTPFAIILTCSDSRVAPELYFDQGLGDLFVLRNAGNVLDDHTIGSIEYAVEHLHAGLIVVVGHAKCGAVAATVAGGHAPGHIHSIVESIAPAYESVAKQEGDKVDNTVRANARRVAGILARVEPILGEAVKSGRVKVVAGRYDLATGRVEILP